MEEYIVKLKDKCTCCGELLKIKAVYFSQDSLHISLETLAIGFSGNNKITEYRTYLMGTYIGISLNDKKLFYSVCSDCQKKHKKEETIKEIIFKNLNNNMKLNIYKDIRNVSCRVFV